MPIKFKCPNPSCQKTLSVKDQLAGKKAACPACKKVLTIPTPPTVATPAPAVSGQDAEALAASFLADEPKAAAEEPTTIDFTCPYCDEELHLNGELAGKQAPCPECKRIVKVPQLVKQQKADWRGGAAGIPSGARRDTEPAPEGAWGSTTKTVVSGEALEEAGALASQRREPVTLARWIMRGMLAAAGVGVLVVGVLLVKSWLGGKQQKTMLDKAMEALSTNKVTGAAGAVIHMGAGQYHLRRNEKDSIKPDKGDRGAKNQFEAARNRLRDRTPDCDALLVELALAQLGMAGSSAEVAEGKRMTWADALKEAGLTLLAIREPQQRAQGLRRLTRLLIKKEQAPLARDLARQLGGGPEAFAVVALEYLRANQKEDAAKLLKAIRPSLKPQKGPAGKPLPVPLSVDVVALMVAFSEDKDVPEPKEGALKDVVTVGKAAGLAWRGQPEQSRKVAEKASSSLVRLEALVAAADAPSAETEALTGEAIALAEKTESLPGWLMVRLVREGLHANVSEERLLGLAQRLAPKDPMRGWVEMPVFRARLARAEGKAEESLLELVDKGSLAHAQACVELAQHNTLKDKDTDKAVDKWDESLRPFGYIGVALGLQGRD
jgi:hypothetical protein